jgi:phosphatidylserine decarboxylase
VVFIQAKNDAVGLIYFIAEGMTEVAMCGLTVNEGDTVKKGDQ